MCLAAGVFAADSINEYAGTTSAQFLRIGIGARPAALGESYCAVSDDTYGVFWNPAGANRINAVEYAFSYNKWFSDIGKEVVMASLPVKSTSTVSFGMIYLHVPSMVKSDIYGNDKGKFTAYSMAGVLSYSSRIHSDSFAYGVSVKYLQEGIDTDKAVGYCLDLGGMYYASSDRFSIGASVQNLGSKMKFVSESFSLPMTLKTGCAYRFKNNKALMLFDINKATGEDIRYSAGLEYSVYKALALRGGYNTGNSFTCGFGIMYKLLFFDYAFVPYGDLGYTHRVSTRMKFGYEVRHKYPKEEKKTSEKKAEKLPSGINFVYGTVVDIDKNPVENPTVRISQNGDERLRIMAYPLNTYKTPELAVGKYEIKVWKTGYMPEIRDIVITENQEPLKLDFELIPVRETNAVYGKVVDSENNALQNVIIEVFQKGKKISTVYSGADGNYLTPELPFGNYTLRISSENHHTERVKCKIERGRPILINIPLAPLSR